MLFTRFAPIPGAECSDGFYVNDPSAKVRGLWLKSTSLSLSSLSIQWPGSQMRMLRWHGHGTGACHLSVPPCRWSLKGPSGCGPVRSARQAVPPLARGICVPCRGDLAGVELSALRILTIRAQGRGSYQRTNVDGSGFPRGYLTRTKRIRGFSTGDLVQATVPPPRKTAGVHVGRVAVRATGSFRVGKVDGINAKYVVLLQRKDGYEYGQA